MGAVDDLSGNGKHLLQATAGKRPLYSAVGGVFDGVDDWMAVNFSLNADQPITYVMVYSVEWDPSGDDTRYLFDSYNDATEGQILLSRSGGSETIITANFGISYAHAFPSGRVQLTATYVASAASVWQDGSLKGTGTPGGRGFDGLTFGASRLGAGNILPTQATFRGFALYKSDETANRTAIEDWCTARWPD